MLIIHTHTLESIHFSLYLHEALKIDVSFSFMHCSRVSHYRPAKVPFRTSHSARGQAGLRPGWRCRWCGRAGRSGQGRAGQGRAGPARPPRPPARSQRLIDGHGSGFCVPMTHRKRHPRLRPERARPQGPRSHRQ